ncbi:SDR family NAD(P)-dependent oxidoreductase [Rhodobacteraceae bacterium D3-12]|nr:SDR family NAD(P)-dependent oxidoreductase [Rhodobacteraceae bacterium D3-12]
MSVKTAIITGGAGGLGLALDAGLRARGWATVLIDLPGPALDGVEPLANRTTHACDLTDTGALTALCDRLRHDHDSIDMVIYNAGITWIGDFADLSDPIHRKVFEINYFAAVNMAQALRDDLRRARGTHLAISSVAGFSALYRRTAYAASKHALDGFFKSLRSEEKPHGVRCLVAAPSFVATNIGGSNHTDGTARPGSATDGIDYMSPADAAETILKGVDKSRNMIPVGRIAWLAWLINRASPRLFEHLMQRRIAKTPKP